MECYQPVGSFKLRGMGRLCQTLVADGRRHLFSSSGGNAGYAVAYSGKKLGVPVTIVVPEGANEVVCDTIRSEGAEIIKHGRAWDDAHEHAVKLAENAGGGYVHPFDNGIAWQGHASLIDEAVTQCKKPDVIVLSVGGGGLFCGVMTGLLRSKFWQDVPVVTVETEGAASLKISVDAGQLVKLEKITSIATTLGARQVAAQALDFAQNPQVQCVAVTDQQAVSACLIFADDHRILVEPACGAALAVVYDRLAVLDGAENVLVVVCGGMGVSMQMLSDYKKQFAI